MKLKRMNEFRKDAVRIALTSGLTCRQVADDLGIGVSARGLRAFCNRPAGRGQWSDLITLAHIEEQSRLGLGSYDRPGMTEELKEISLDVGHHRGSVD